MKQQFLFLPLDLYPKREALSLCLMNGKGDMLQPAPHVDGHYHVAAINKQRKDLVRSCLLAEQCCHKYTLNFSQLVIVNLFLCWVWEFIRNISDDCKRIKKYIQKGGKFDYCKRIKKSIQRSGKFDDCKRIKKSIQKSGKFDDFKRIMKSIQKSEKFDDCKQKKIYIQKSRKM
jgi:hypothetical protein